ncbi:MAG: c-type cytochrome [Chloroflexota bacterium]
MRTIIKWLGIAVGILVALLVIAAAFIYFRSEAVMNKQYSVQVADIPIPADPAAIERGRHLVTSASACIDCHGENLAGGIVVDDPALGRIVAPNLTTGKNGSGSKLSSLDIVRTLRYGVLPDGRSVRVMPSDDYTHLSNADLAAIVAYLRSLAPVDSDLPPVEIRPFGRLLLATGQLPIMIAERIDFNAAGQESITPEISLEYGRYLADISGCTGCHGPGLSGGLIPGTPPDWPPAANLTPDGDVGQWSEADFIQTMRTGVAPDGEQLAAQMPWMTYRNMTDDELQALWLFISTVPAKPAGSR